MNQHQLNVAQASKCHRIGDASFPLMDDRQRGQKLVAGLTDGTALDPEQVLSAVHDLLPASDPMLEPLKLMVQRPEFLALAMPRLANRQTNGQDQEEALLRFLSTSYSPEIVARLREILTGVREQWASRSPKIIEHTDVTSSESSSPISLTDWQEYMKHFNSASISSSNSSTAPSDQAGQTNDSIPPQTSLDDLHVPPQQLHQDWKVNKPIAIETLDKTMNFKLSGRDLFQKNKKLYIIYISSWPISALIRLIWRFFNYPTRMKENIERNIKHINCTLSEQRQEENR